MNSYAVVLFPWLGSSPSHSSVAPAVVVALRGRVTATLTWRAKASHLPMRRQKPSTLSAQNCSAASRSEDADAAGDEADDADEAACCLASELLSASCTAAAVEEEEGAAGRRAEGVSVDLGGHEKGWACATEP